MRMTPRYGDTLFGKNGLAYTVRYYRLNPDKIGLIIHCELNDPPFTETEFDSCEIFLVDANDGIWQQRE